MDEWQPVADSLLAPLREFNNYQTATALGREFLLAFRHPLSKLTN
jgi:hypothetical protein